MGIVYIGMTTLPVKKRWSQHITDSRKDKPSMDITYLIKERFTFDIIEECDSSVVYDRERYWINYYDRYNNRRGGGYRLSDYSIPLQRSTLTYLLLTYSNRYQSSGYTHTKHLSFL